MQDQAAHLALSSVLSSMGGSVLFEGCPDDDMDLVWRGRVELIAVEGVLPDTSVKLGTKDTEYQHAKIDDYISANVHFM